jgi:nickel/cobalt exporter
MLRTQMRLVSAACAQRDAGKDHDAVLNVDAQTHHADPSGASPPEAHANRHPHEHGPHYHSHGWGFAHTHDIEAVAQARPSLAILLGLGIAGGLLPDPGALAILLSAIASGKLVLGLLTVLVFSLGFASVLVVVGVVAAHVGQLILAWLSSRWIAWVQIGAALLIIGVGLVLTANAWRTVAKML